MVRDEDFQNLKTTHCKAQNAKQKAHLMSNNANHTNKGGNKNNNNSKKQKNQS